MRQIANRTTAIVVCVAPAALFGCGQSRTLNECITDPVAIQLDVPAPTDATVGDSVSFTVKYTSPTPLVLELAEPIQGWKSETLTADAGGIQRTVFRLPAPVGSSNGENLVVQSIPAEKAVPLSVRLTTKARCLQFHFSSPSVPPAGTDLPGGCRVARLWEVKGHGTAQRAWKFALDQSYFLGSDPNAEVVLQVTLNNAQAYERLTVDYPSAYCDSDSVAFSKGNDDKDRIFNLQMNQWRKSGKLQAGDGTDAPEPDEKRYMLMAIVDTQPFPQVPCTLQSLRMTIH